MQTHEMKTSTLSELHPLFMYQTRMKCTMWLYTKTVFCRHVISTGFVVPCHIYTVSDLAPVDPDRDMMTDGRDVLLPPTPDTLSPDDSDDDDDDDGLLPLVSGPMQRLV